MPDQFCDSAGVVYAMECAMCSAEYVGETCRCVPQRFREHHFQARHKTQGTPWGTHMAEKHGQRRIVGTDVVFVRARVLARETRSARRKIREAIEIRDRKPSVNLYKGWALAPKTSR